MDIIIGSGNKRQKITFASGYAMKKYEKDDPIGYVKTRGFIMDRIRKRSK